MAAQPKLLPLVEAIGARYQSLNVDAKLVNAFAEKGEGEGELFVYKRPAFAEVVSQRCTAGVARGMTFWNGAIYCITDGNVHKNGVVIGTVSSSGFYYFSSCLGASPKLFFQNGANAYTTDGTTVTAVSDVHYPASTVGGTAYLDGTTYVLTPAASIAGSTAAGNDPTTWDPLNVLLAQIEPQAGIFLAKQLVYLLVMKEHYTEAFYDAGNATGSPLAPVQGAKMNFGCVDGRSVRDVGGDLMWVADSGEGDPTVVMVSNLKLDIVSTPKIERLLAPAASAGNFYSWNVRIAGHRLYGITNVVENITLVYDLTSRLWYQWSDYLGNYLPYAFSCTGFSSLIYFLHESNGKVFSMSVGAYHDDTQTPFPVQIYTPNFDGGTRRNKSLGRMDMLGDKVSTTVAVAYSDDDYGTWTSADPFDMSLDRPSIANLGGFTKRAFRFTHQDESPLRIRAVEMYLDVGAS